MDSLQQASPVARDVDRSHGTLGRVALWLLHRAGWSVVVARPIPARAVIVFAPHTSNWDFVVGLLAKWAIGIRVAFVAKDTLFDTPLAPLLRRVGGIPVNRREHTGFIDRMRAEFESSDTFRLVIAPEGTRSYAPCWKSGFYHLARIVGVPVGLAFIDYAGKRIGIGAYIELGDDAARDMAGIAAFYADKRGRDPARQGPVRLGA